MSFPNTQPNAIYVSRPPSGSSGAHWLGTPFRIPVIVQNPYIDWPDLNWESDDIHPQQFSEGAPHYLWAVPVADPINTTTFSFGRQWDAIGSQFTSRLIPTGVYDFVISHAADDRYTMELLLNGQVLVPVGVNNGTNPSRRPWRNVKSYVYEDIPVNSRAVLRLETTATNIGRSDGTPQTNPAMFTWTFQMLRNQ